MTRNAIKGYTITEYSTEGMHYRADIVETRTGKAVESITRPTMKEVHDELERQGYNLV